MQWVEAPQEGVENEKNVGPRAQKPPLLGKRSGVLKDPAPQGAVTVSYVAAKGPLLCTPLLADTAAQTVDARTVKYLVHAALEEEEEERRKAKEERRLEVTALLALPIALRTPAQQRRIMELSDEVDAEALSSHPGRWKRKKRRNKTSSVSPLVAALVVDNGTALAVGIGSGMLCAVFFLLSLLVRFR